MVPVIGVAALALEYGHALLQKAEDQRVADLAAFGGALVYGSTSSSTNAASAAANVAALNGISCSSCASVVSSPTGDGNSAVKVTVTTNVPLILARVLTTNATLPVSATGYAEIKSSAPACVIALHGSGSGVSLSGGATLTAPGCAIASNATVTAHACSNVITTEAVDYNGTAPTPTCAFQTSGGATPKMNRVLTTDPLAPSSGSPGSIEVTSATARISSVSGIGSPSLSTFTVPSNSTTTSFTKTGVSGLPVTCSYSYNSGTLVYSVTCSGTTTFGTITVNKVTVTLATSSGNTYNFNQAWPISGVSLSGSGGTYGFAAGITTSGTTTFPAGTYYVLGSITTGGGATTNFGAGTYNVSGGIINGGGSTTLFGAGTFNIGASASACGNKGPTGESICNASSTSLIFNGPSTFTLAGGVYNSGSAILTLGSGSSNSYWIGQGSDHNSINDPSSGTMTLADATGTNTQTCTGSISSTFCAFGNITSGGGSSLVLPAAAEHDVNGNIDLSGNATLGAGIYTINGYFALGASSGGTVFTALGVSLVISGSHTVTCNGVASSAFCLGAGYNTVDLTAPTASSVLGSSAANLAVIGPQSSSNTAAAAFTTGATNTQISGAFYFPNGPVTMSGAAALHDTVDSNACLELIGSQVTLSNGSAAGSTCTGLSGGSLGTTVFLVQ